MSIEDELSVINLRKRIGKNFRTQNDADYLEIMTQINLMQRQNFQINEAYEIDRLINCPRILKNYKFQDK